MHTAIYMDYGKIKSKKCPFKKRHFFVILKSKEKINGKNRVINKP